MDEARPTGVEVEAMEREGRVGKDSSRVEWGDDHCTIMAMGGSVEVGELTEITWGLEAEGATQGVLVEMT